MICGSDRLLKPPEEPLSPVRAASVPVWSVVGVPATVRS